MSPSFTFTDTQHAADAVLGAHAHEHDAISYVVTGRRTYRFDSAELDCVTGAMVFVPAGAMHSTRFTRSRSQGLMLEVCDVSAVRRHLFVQPRCAVSLDLARRCDSIRREMWNPDDLTTLTLENLGFEILSSNHGVEEERPPLWLRRVRDLLHESLRRPPSLQRLAEEADVDRSRLTREFRRHFDVSIGEYLRRLRVQRAWQLVTTSALPLSEVALAAGFSDQSHLTRAFHRAYLIPPARLRRSLRAFKTRGTGDD
jgi:AraC family transcriptional regulator